MHAETATSSSTRSSRAVMPRSASVTDDLQELESALGPARAFARGRSLFRAGETCTGVYVIEKGSIKVSALSQNGEEQVVRFCLPGELLGIEAISELRHRSTAVALEDTRVRILTVSALQALCRRSPKLTHQLFRLVSRRIADLHAHKLMLGRKTAPERLAAFLTDMKERTHTQELQLSMSREAIGSYLGIALETVSRLLHQFEHDKLIRVSGRRLRLIAPARLRAMAASSGPH